ncbi:MAG: glycoside hydrolase family 43 protein, partial [Acidobacteriota bacterium]
MRFAPKTPTDEAGLVAVQSDAFYYAFGLSRGEQGELVLRVRQRDGEEDPARGEVVAEQPLELASGAPVHLRIDVRGPEVDFAYSLDGESFEAVVTGADGRTLSSMHAGGFVGALIGLYAEGDG